MSVIEKDKTIEEIIAPNSDHISQILERAADKLMEMGWCQGFSVDSKERMCISGAIMVAANYNTVLWNKGLRRMRQFFEFECDDDIITWNDHPERTKEEVIRVLREAAAL